MKDIFVPSDHPPEAKTSWVPLIVEAPKEHFPEQGKFVLKDEIVWNYYVPSSIKGMAGKTVYPKRFVVRRHDAEKTLLAVIVDGNRREVTLPLTSFKRHLPEEELRANNCVRVI